MNLSPAELTAAIQTAQGVVAPLAPTGVDLAAELDAVQNIIIHYESGGNPLAVNMEDRNAKACMPSCGLMQIVKTTWDAHKQPGYDQDATDPVSNIICGLVYIYARYGSTANVPGVKAVRAGGSYVGY
jgi:SLT domain-containing protein